LVDEFQLWVMDMESGILASHFSLGSLLIGIIGVFLTYEQLQQAL
jgi:hypothetical protein